MFTPDQGGEREWQAGVEGTGGRSRLRRGERRDRFEMANTLFLPCHLQEQGELAGWDLQMLDQQFSDLARRAACIGFDLEYQRERTPHALGKFLLRHIQRLAPAFDPCPE
jgi:hypothetical protein